MTKTPWAPFISIRPIIRCWPSREHNNAILLDFEDPKPERESWKLGSSERVRGRIFLAIEKFGGGEFRRVGYAELIDYKKGWKILLSSTEREIIVTE